MFETSFIDFKKNHRACQLHTRIRTTPQKVLMTYEDKLDSKTTLFEAKVM